MPTYEFRCPDGHDFEKFYRSIGSAPADVQCPRCGAVSTKLMSAGGGLVFKGSGFYITDYGKDGKKKQEAPLAKSENSKPESGSSEKPESGSSEKSEPAPPAKAADTAPAAAATAKPAADTAAKPKPTKE